MKKIMIATLLVGITSLFAAEMQGMNMDSNTSEKMGQHCNEVKKQNHCNACAPQDQNTTKKHKKHNPDSNSSK